MTSNVFKSVWDAIADTPEEAENLKARAALMHHIRARIEKDGLTQTKAAALALATTHQVQYWDALIIASCAEHGVKQFYTEDGPGITKPLGVRCTDPF